jgi:fructose-bisphosphate aldolase, class I
MGAQELHETAQAIVADHKGILAADESTGTIKKRFDAIGLESTEEHRRQYRQLLFAAPAMEDFIGGVIMYDETIRQSSDDGTPFPQVLSAKGVIPGIKVDTGAHDQALFPGEKITEGLDGLRGRLAEYRELGARFAKWRAVITIGDGIPTVGCIRANAHALARYSALCQEAGIVPIVEPEVLMDADNTIERCFDVTSRTLKWTFHELLVQRVDLRGALLKPNMVISGKGSPEQAPAARIAELTVECFLTHVPAAIPGVVFLSGGQSEVEATANLNAINQVGGPWPLSFSYGRALQQSALSTWNGDPENVDSAQAVFAHRARMNALAAAGEWSAEVEEQVAV